MSVSLPTMADVIGYEEKEAGVVSRMQCGYPRFFEHPYIGELKAFLREEHDLPNGIICLVGSERSLETLIEYVDARVLAKGNWSGFYGVVLAEDQAEVAERAKGFLQHTGMQISSREAEDGLVRLGLRPSIFEEILIERDAESLVIGQIARMIGVDIENLFLARGGMNAFYASFIGISEWMAERGRTRWVQLGWMYVDTSKILELMGPGGTPPIVWYDVADLEGLADLLEKEKASIAGIVTEVPTNPLIETVDLERLRAIADSVGCALIVDPTMGSVANVDVFRYADVLVTSLTKFAGNECDVMIGALAVNRDQVIGRNVFPFIQKRVLYPYVRDVQRLAAQIGGWFDLIEAANESLPQVVAFLEHHSAVDCVWWTGSREQVECYRKIERKTGGFGAVLSFSLKIPLADFYDRLELPKGPSFGALFTMLCPFIYLAHYDLIKTESGRAFLAQAGIPIDLIRMSIGAEPASQIIDRLARALGD